MLSEMVLQVLFKRNLILNKQLNLTAVIAAIQTQSQMKNQSQIPLVTRKVCQERMFLSSQ